MKLHSFTGLLFMLGLLLIFSGLVFFRSEDFKTLINTYFSENRKIVLDSKNEYYRDYDFAFVKNTDSFSPRSQQDMLNIYYTVINAGKDEFTFYCPREYEACLTDVQDLANNQDLLSEINNYVHPFNGFSHIATEYDNLGKVTIRIEKTYSEEDIKKVSEKVNALYPQLVNNNLSTIDNIRNIHDFIINNTEYDSARSDLGDTTYPSDTAMGPLFYGYGICGGYTDLMELFLEKMNIKSFKVSSDLHVWNAVFLDNKWYHLDLTWDDPVSEDGKNYLQYNYFLIDTNKLLETEMTEHDFIIDNYPELKGA